MLSRRDFIRLAIGGAILAPAGLAVYASQIEPHWLQITSARMPVRGLPENLVGKRLAHFTDVHVGPEVADDYVLRVFERVRALRPDIVVYTGDLVTYRPGIDQQAAQVYRHAPRGALGTIAVLGNHDYGPDWAHPEIGASLGKVLESLGVRVLHNEVAEVEGLQIVGFDDLWANLFDAKTALARVDAERPMIGLTHNPDSVDLAGWEGFSGWILSGHTHGGQVKPPFMAPPRLPLRDRRYSAGTFELSGGRTLYVNRGVGHINKVRFNCRPEVALFELRRAQE
jgi:predicted MPP superfamily phosphohydrolase